MIYREVQTPTYIENFCIEKFIKQKNISILCDDNLLESLMEYADGINFKDKIINYGHCDNLFIVSRVNDVLIIESADKKTVENDIVIIPYAEKYEDIQAIGMKELYLLSTKEFSQVKFINDYYMEFGG